MSASQNLMLRDPAKSIIQAGPHHRFSHSDLIYLQDPTGITLEEGEFIYGLIRMLQPNECLETGTNVGISASFICLGLHDNGHGHLTTIEYDRTTSAVASNKLSRMGFSNFTVVNKWVSEFDGVGPFDFLWLDSTIEERFNELVRFFPMMTAGAIACIHDTWELDNPSFAPIPIEMLKWLKTGELRAMTFSTPHGVSVFQKRRENDFLADLSKLP